MCHSPLGRTSPPSVPRVFQKFHFNPWDIKGTLFYQLGHHHLGCVRQQLLCFKALFICFSPRSVQNPTGCKPLGAFKPQTKASLWSHAWKGAGWEEQRNQNHPLGIGENGLQIFYLGKSRIFVNEILLMACGLFYYFFYIVPSFSVHCTDLFTA